MTTLHPRLRRLAVLTLCSTAVIASSCARQQGDASASPAAALPMLDSARLLGDIGRLAHDSMAGRGVMTAENAEARAWLASELRRIGLEPVGGSYEHAFARSRRNRPDSVRGANVLGVVRGTEKPDEFIVVSAHYDHVGVREGKIYNGADDNASGTAAVLAMAAHFKAHPPRHSMIFALWDAEESGLLGARAFVASPPVPIAAIKANVNLDMVSRNDRNELYAAGASPYPQMRPILEATQRVAAVNLKLGHDSGGGSEDWTNQSDQGAFHQVKIPFVYFGVEDHPDYHQPTDDVENIQPGFYYRAVRTIAGFVERLDRALP
ncbi:MAG TPA: M20/M25/M40 family metallo-hydrolase [Gemmatimonadaceae bacterium]|nr:M20/M25/M40 family metallo-hydrolase [Gemmatimonadaceae bacterium]